MDTKPIEVHNPNTGAVITLTEVEFEIVRMAIRAYRRDWVNKMNEGNAEETREMVTDCNVIDRLLNIVKD